MNIPQPMRDDDRQRAPAPNRRAPGLLLAWLLLDASMGVYLGLNGPSTISRILLAAGIAFLLLVLLRRPPAAQRPTIQAVEIGFAALLAMELFAHIAVPFRPDQPPPTIGIPVVAGVALAALGVWLVTRLAARRLPNGIANFAVLAALVVVVGAALVARFAVIAFDMEPGFDVPLIQEAAGRALLAGENPYHTYVYDSGYPYWPLAAVLGAGGALAGDARWGLVIADAVTVLAFIVIARNVGAPGRLGALAGGLFLWNSSGLLVTWESLPEPAVIALATVGVALITRPGNRGRLAGIALGCAIAVKQLGLGLLPLLPISRSRTAWTATAIATAVAGAILLPFYLLDPAAFLEGSVSSHMVEPARDFAVNLLDPLPGVVPRITVPLVVTGALALGIGLAVRLRWPDAIDGWLAGSIALLTVAFSLIGISFVNYYQIPLALLLVLVLIPDGWGSEARTGRSGRELATPDVIRAIDR
jgi:hypothetical protein